jgi:lipid A 3-O-deacylase
VSFFMLAERLHLNAKLCAAVALLIVPLVQNAHAASGPEFNRMLFAPHPFAQQSGVVLQPVASPTRVHTKSRRTNIRSTQSPAPIAQTTPPMNSSSHSRPSSGGVWSVQIANEDRGILTEIFEPVFDEVFGGSPTEGGLTWGWRIGYAANKANPDWFKPVKSYMPWINSSTPVRVAYAIEQEAMTPSENAKADGRTVRPNAGHLALSTRLVFMEEKSKQWQRIDTLDVAIGLVGEASGAKALHGSLPGHDTDSWDGIESEPILNIGYEYGHRFFVFEPNEMGNIEIHPYVGGALGNALTYGSAGVNLRFGRNLLRDLGAPRQRTLMSGDNFVDPGKYWAWNLFMGLEGRAIAHNVFLDGNLLQDSKSVDSKPLVYDFQMGLEGGYGAYRVSVMNVYRSREFDGQQYSTEFVRVGASATF